MEFCAYRDAVLVPGRGIGREDLFIDAEFLRFDTVRIMKKVLHFPSMPSSLYELKRIDTDAAETVGRICCSE
jgi:hypothetical protein